MSSSSGEAQMTQSAPMCFPLTQSKFLGVRKAGAGAESCAGAFALITAFSFSLSRSSCRGSGVAGEVVAYPELSSSVFLVGVPEGDGDHCGNAIVAHCGQ